MVLGGKRAARTSGRRAQHRRRVVPSETTPQWWAFRGRRGAGTGSAVYAGSSARPRAREI